MRRRVAPVIPRSIDTVIDMGMPTAGAASTTGRTTAPAPGRPAAPTAGREQGPARCLWCARELPSVGSLGRRRRYCAQACRQRAYENRNALQRGGLPADAVVLSADERDDLADRLYQVRCAAEDISTALAEGVRPGELESLVDQLVLCARQAEHIR